MCAGDDRNCPEFELHRQQLLEDLDTERRSFLKSAFVATGGAAALTAGGVALVAPAAGPDGGARQGKPEPSLRARDRRDRPLGLFQQAAQARRRDQFRRLCHHRDVDASRQRRRRAHGQGRSRRRECLPVDQGQEGREPARRRSDRRQAVGTRRGRGVRRAHLHRPGLCPQRRARRCPRGADHGREAATMRESRPMPANHSAAMRPRGGDSTTRNCSPSPSRARSSRSTRSTPPGSATGRRLSTISNGRRRPIRSAWCTRPSTIPGVPVDHSTIKENHGILKNVRIPIRPHFGVMGWRPRKPMSSIPSRPAISAATSTTGASARARPCTTRSPFRARCYRPAIRMLRRAIRNSAAPRSNAR